MTVTTEEAVTIGDYEALAVLSKDVREAAAHMGRDEVRMLVDLYYRLQEHRIALDGQVRALTASERPHETVEHFAGNVRILENQCRRPLQAWVEASPAGQWALAVKGIGPVLAAGAMSTIDVTIADTAGKVWSFFGLDPTRKWNKGEKRPWSADAKVLAWKIGDSFVKVSSREGAHYGAMYRRRKELELRRDSDGVHAQLCREELERRGARMSPEQRKHYESGHLPPGRIDLRARRVPVKLFLAHLHEMMYRDHFHQQPPAPYPLTILGHAESHRITPEDMIR